MKISKSKLKRIIQEELEEARLMDPSTRGKRKVAMGWAHKGDMSPEEIERRNREMKARSSGYEDGINGREFHGVMRFDEVPSFVRQAYSKGYKSGLADSRKGETDLMPYEAELAGLEEPRIGTRMGPYKDEYAAAPPEEHDPGREVDAYKNPRNPAYARPVNEIKITKSQLKQIIKEELEGLISEQKIDRGTVMSDLANAGVAVVRYDPSSKLSDALVTIINSGRLERKKAIDFASKTYKQYVEQSKNELHPNVKEAGGSEKYIKKRMGMLAVYLNKETKGGAEKPQATSSKPPEHIQRMKRKMKAAKR